MATTDSTEFDFDNDEDELRPAPRLSPFQRAKAVAKRGVFGYTQLAGSAAILAGIYHAFGLSATLIIGGVATVAVSTLREGGRI